MNLNKTQRKLGHFKRLRSAKESNDEMKIKNAKESNDEMKAFFGSEKLLEEMKDKIIFSEEEEKMVEHFFDNINYYRFSIYPKLLSKTRDDDDEFFYSFTDALNLYKFDEFLKKNLYDFTSFLENKWKGSFICFLGKEYTNPNFYMAQCYLDLNLYSSEEWGEKIILNLQETILKSSAISIKHHVTKRNGYVPIWVLVEELTLGQFETFFTQIREDLRRNYVKDNYDNLYFKRINSWISVIRELRNKISHHSRLYGANFTKSPSFLKLDKKKHFTIHTGEALNVKKNQLVSSFYVINKFLLHEDETIQKEWNSFLCKLKSEIDSKSEILNIEKYLGFNEDDLESFKIDV